MKMLKKLMKVMAIMMCVIALNSCDNGPDYGKMRVSRMDIVGAKAVGFIDADNNSRGEAISSGLYKIDAAGNITAVAVYFTEDESGNQSKHESEVKMGGGSMKDVGNDFIYFTGCWFVDKKGELIPEQLPFRILVRKSDGKMWNLDYKACGLNIQDFDDRQFFQSYDGTLYYASCESFDNRIVENIYKFDLKTEPATIQQVTANIELYPPYAVDSKGVICAPVNKFRSHYYSNKIAWPNSGFQEIKGVSTARTDYSDQVEGLVIEPDDYYSVVCFRGQFYQLGAYDYNSNISEYPFVDLATCNKILIGDTPGSASVDESETINLKNDILAKWGFESYSSSSSIMVTPDYILLSTRLDSEDKCWISALNPEKKEWKWITETPDLINFNKSIFYNNRYWSITEQDNALGAFWFHPGSFESGFVKFNVTLPDYINSSKYEAVDGKVIFSGINPADSHLVKVAVDLMTGNAITNDEAPEMFFSTLISLN